MLKRTLCTFLAVLFVLAALSTGALAEKKTATGYAKENGVKVYKTWSTDSDVWCTIDKNDTVQVSAVKGGWCQVVNGNLVGYVQLSKLSNKPIKDEMANPIATMTGYAKQDGVKVYAKNSTSSRVLCTLNTNDAVQVSAVKGGWCQVVNGSNVGYVKLNMLSNKPVKAEEFTNPIKLMTGYAKKDGVKVYASWSKSSDVVATLSVNQTVQVSAVKGSWCQVVTDGAFGYVPLKDLSNKPVTVAAPAVKTTTAYIKTDGVKVFDTWNTSGKVLATLNMNDTVQVSATNNGWCQVVNGSAYGYIPKDNLSATKVSLPEFSLKVGDTGEAVEALQNRLKELGYFTGTVGGNYKTLTQSAVAAFQMTCGLEVTGDADALTLSRLAAKDAPKYAPVEPEASTTGYSTAKAATGTAIEMDWWDSGISSIFARGTIAVVTDVKTGISWYVKRTGGTNHADVQPLTAADTASMKKACGGWSWDRRAIFVTINGVNYAASMNCMPHGSDSISDNNFDGHHCIHFTNSRTHGGNKVCSLHQSAIKKAAAATL